MGGSEYSRVEGGEIIKRLCPICHSELDENGYCPKHGAMNTYLPEVKP